jgi:hypothetical protein
MAFRILSVQIGDIVFNPYGQMRQGRSFYLLKNVEEFLTALGPVRRSDTPRQGSHGVESSLSYYPARPLPFEVEIHAVDFDTRVAMENALKREIALPAAQDFDVEDGYRLVKITDEGGNLIQCYAKLDQSPSFRKFAERRSQSSSCLFTMIAEDPALYSQTLQQESGGEASNTTNFTIQDGDLPTIQDGDLPTIQDSSIVSLTVTNDGIFGSPAFIVVSGPTESPVILNITTGRLMKFSGLTLLAGERIEIDTSNFTAVKYDAGGTTTNVKGYMTPTSKWIFIEPGDNEFSLLDATPGDLSAQLEVRFRSAWI